MEVGIEDLFNFGKTKEDSGVEFERLIPHWYWSSWIECLACSDLLIFGLSSYIIYQSFFFLLHFNRRSYNMEHINTIKNQIFSSSAHFIILSVSRKRSSVETLPNTIMMPYYPFTVVKNVDKHPPAFVVTPVLTPTMLLLSSSLLVFVQYMALHTTLPSLKNLNNPL